MAVGIIGLIALQAVLGLVFQREYRDVPWITATWFGNDWITLLAAVPTMTLALVRMRNGSPRWLLVWLGMLLPSFNDCIYNYLCKPVKSRRDRPEPPQVRGWNRTFESPHLVVATLYCNTL